MSTPSNCTLMPYAPASRDWSAISAACSSLGRDAASVQAGAAEVLVLLDERDTEAELDRAQSARVSTTATA